MNVTFMGFLYLVYDPAAAAVDENPDAVASMSYVGSDHTFLKEEEMFFCVLVIEMYNEWVAIRLVMYEGENI